jgi:hypothetical protein
MSTEHLNNGPGGLPVHQDVAFEERDVRVSIILKFLVWMAVVIILSFGFSLVFYRGLLHYWNSEYMPPPPSRAEAGSMMPPEPRMQGMPGHFNDPQLDMREKVQEDTAANESMSWVDQKAGIAKIPVSDAMKMIAEKGFSAGNVPVEKKQAEPK